MNPTVVAAIGAALLLLLLGGRVLRLFRPGDSALERPAVFFLLMAACLFLVKWPQITCPRAINVDEAQLLAQAMRICSHPIPWRDVDGTTSGPLNSLLLSLPLHLGVPAGWRLARVMLWAVDCLTIIFIYLGLRCFGNRAEAQFALIPTILFYGLSIGDDFNHYSSETLPVLLLAAEMYLLAREWTASGRSKKRLFFFGLVAGSIPFTKMQAAPLAAFLVLAAVALILARNWRKEGGRGETVREVAVLGLGTVLVPSIILGVVAASGALTDFWISYIKASYSYTEQDYAGARLLRMEVLFSKPDFVPYMACALVAAVFLIGTRLAKWGRVRGNLFWPLAVVFAGTALAFFCVAAPGKAFAHYLLLLVPFLAGFTGLAFFAGKGRLASSTGAIVVATAVLMVAPMAWQPVRYLRGAKEAFPREQQPEILAVTRRIAAASRPGDTLAIWGWMPDYNVETGLPPATRDAIGHYVITEGPYREFFRRRFLADLQRSNPAFFVDAVANGTFTWWSWKHGDVHESFPELAAFIDQNYSPWWSIRIISNGIPVRMYLRKDRMAELPPEQRN